jgi:Spy/CpxP family protein refolding chaperone
LVSTWKVILATLVIFIAGVVTGALVAKKSVDRPAPMLPNINRSATLKRLTDDLDLTAGQRKQVNEILQESHERTKLLWEFVGPYFQDEYQDLIADIRSVLQPEQRKQFDQALRQRQRRVTTKQAPEPWRLFQSGGNTNRAVGGPSKGAPSPKPNRSGAGQPKRHPPNPPPETAPSSAEPPSPPATVPEQRQ